tara:strand:- start:450 stop:566 length:117 start_codon:yes stop_codon:yes gene_type:complete
MIRKILQKISSYFNNLLFSYEEVQRKARFKKIKRLKIK